jgi:hypothetical protein
MLPRARFLTAASLVLLGASCAGTPEGTIVIVTGEEADAFSRAPAPTLVIAERIAIDGSRTEVSRATLPAETLDLGELKRSDVGGVGVTALDPGGKVLLRGESLFVQWGALEQTNLEVFVQRTGELARLPRGPEAFDAAKVSMLVGRYVLATNGTSAVLYDLLGLRTLSSRPVLPRPARSVATVGSATLLIDEAGATTYDFSTNQTFPLTAPAGGTFAEVAGGERAPGPDESQHIVGGTRLVGGPTARVLLIDKAGKATFVGLTAPREGACATFVEGRGLVVIGGDSAAAGAELLAPGATLATPLPFPPDPVRGCAATTLDTRHVLVVGGTGAAGDTGNGTPARVLDLACTTTCAPVPWPEPIALVRADAQALAPDAALVVGDDASGATHAFRVSAGGNREVPLRTPRRGARLLPTPTRAFTIVGGAVGIEQYAE